MKRMDSQAQQEKQQGLDALQSERRQQEGQLEAANARAAAAASEAAALRRTADALQRDREARRREAVQPKALGQV